MSKKSAARLGSILVKLSDGHSQEVCDLVVTTAKSVSKNNPFSEEKVLEAMDYLASFRSITGIELSESINAISTLAVVSGTDLNSGVGDWIKKGMRRL